MQGLGGDEVVPEPDDAAVGELGQSSCPGVAAEHRECEVRIGPSQPGNEAHGTEDGGDGDHQVGNQGVRRGGAVCEDAKGHRGEGPVAAFPGEERKGGQERLEAPYYAHARDGRGAGADARVA